MKPPVHPNAVHLCSSGFCVYFLFDCDDVLAYIGSGTAARPLDSMRARGMSRVEVVWMESRDEALDLEREMIEKHTPPLNMMLPPGKGKPAKVLRLTPGQIEYRQL